MDDGLGDANFLDQAVTVTGPVEILSEGSWRVVNRTISLRRGKAAIPDMRSKGPSAAS
jgi:hypothetical protein